MTCLNLYLHPSETNRKILIRYGLFIKTFISKLVIRTKERSNGCFRVYAKLTVNATLLYLLKLR